MLLSYYQAGEKSTLVGKRTQYIAQNVRHVGVIV